MCRRPCSGRPIPPLEKGRTDKAIGYLKQYLQFRPDDHDTAVRLADLMVERADARRRTGKGAQTSCTSVSSAKPRSGTEVGPQAGRPCAIEMRRYRGCPGTCPAITRRRSSPMAIVHAQVAGVWSLRVSRDEARVEFEQAVALAPTHIPAFEQYADLLERHFKKPTEAGDVLDRLVAGEPDRPEAPPRSRAAFSAMAQADECLKTLTACSSSIRKTARPWSSAPRSSRPAATCGGPRDAPGRRCNLPAVTPTATGPCRGWS